MTLIDLQTFARSLSAIAAASRYRTLSAVKSLLAFGHRLGYLHFDTGSVLRLPAVGNRLAERILSEADVHRMIVLEANERNRVSELWGSAGATFRLPVIPDRSLCSARGE